VQSGLIAARRTGAGARLARSTVMANDKPQAQHKHPPEWERDLNPSQTGQSMIGDSPGADPRGRTARDVKELEEALEGVFTDSELREIPLVGEGERLHPGATYLDLATRDSSPFTAGDRMVASPGSFLVRRSEVPDPYWNRLVGNREVERSEGLPTRR
jgi:hypothetical protein